MKDVSNLKVESVKMEAAKNKEYFDMLNDVDARQKFFGAITTENAGDNSTIKSVKSKISSMIQQEMAEMGLKNQLSQEEQMALEQDTYAEVSTKSNFTSVLMKVRKART